MQEKEYSDGRKMPQAPPQKRERRTPLAGKEPSVLGAPTPKKKIKKDPTVELFLTYAKTNNLQEMERLLEAHPHLDLECADEKGYTALIEAASKGYTQMAAFLLERGAILDQQDCDGYTALMWAIEKEQQEVITFLLEKGASIHTTLFKIKEVALIIAARGGNIKIVKQLYACNPAAIHIADKNGFTPLLTAVAHGHSEVVTFLLSKSASLVAETRKTSKNDACNAWSLAVRNYIVEKSFSFLKIMQEIVSVDRGWINAPLSKTGTTALIYAAENGDLELVVFLLEHGASLNLTDTVHQSSALVWAAYNGHVAVVQYLIDQGADVTCVGKDGISVIQHVQNYGKKNRRTLHEKEINELKNLTSYIERAVASAYASPLSSPSAHASASARIRPFQDQESRNKAFLGYAKAGKVHAMKRVYEEAAGDIDVDYMDNQGETALIHMAYAGSIEMVRFLISEQATIDHRDKKGNTALLYAVEGGHTEVALFLIEKGAYAQFWYGKTQPRTLLMIAAAWGHLDLVQQLLKHNKQNQADTQGNTALTLAAEKDHLSVVICLLENKDLRLNKIDTPKLQKLKNYLERKQEDRQLIPEKILALATYIQAVKVAIENKKEVSSSAVAAAVKGRAQPLEKKRKHTSVSASPSAAPNSTFFRDEEKVVKFLADMRRTRLEEHAACSAQQGNRGQPQSDASMQEPVPKEDALLLATFWMQENKSESEEEDFSLNTGCR